MSGSIGKELWCICHQCGSHQFHIFLGSRRFRVVCAACEEVYGQGAFREPPSDVRGVEAVGSGWDVEGELVSEEEGSEGGSEDSWRQVDFSGVGGVGKKARSGEG